MDPGQQALHTKKYERRRALSDNEWRFKNFIDEGVDGVWRLELDNPVPLDLPVIEQVERLYRDAYFSEANQALAEQFGYERMEQIIGVRLATVLPRELPESLPLLARMVKAGYAAKAFEMVTRDRRGARKVFSHNFAGECEDNRLLRIWGTSKDITRQRQLEEETRLRSEVFEQIPEGCVIVEAPSENMVYVNSAFTRMTGYAIEEIPGPKLSFLQGDDTDPGTVDAIRTAVAHAEPFVGEILNYRKDGTPFWNLMRISPITNADGRVTHYVGILTDISADKLREKHLNEQRTQLEHLSRAATMGELTAALAHELNQPLSAILMNAQAVQRYLKQSVPDIDNLREIVGDIVSDNKRASEVIRRMRHLFRRDDTHYQRQDINALIEEVFVLLRSELTIRQVVLSLHLAAGLPAVLGDPVQLQQVMLNLITNACQAVRVKGGEQRMIDVSTEKLDDEWIEVRVEDSGPGIDVDALDRIFEPFFTTREEGLGMGLVINRRVAEAHGGRLWAENAGGGGAVFRLTLPVAQ